ncbi:integrase [Gammaproteobacteria bacterium 42_54_T18]|nr:integrase [Gammaproteobacteria bacterium 42_54_T18]
MTNSSASIKKVSWNKGKLVGQKIPFKLEEIWGIRIRLEIADNIRELALFNLAIDSKLRACDLVNLRVLDVSHGSKVQSRAMVIQKKTNRPVQFEITKRTQASLERWIDFKSLKSDDYLFKSRLKKSPHLSTRQYARIVDRWVNSLGLDPVAYGTHTLRRTKVSLIYKRTKNLRAIQLLLGHSNLESTVRYLGVDVDDALELAEQTDV